MKPDSLMLQRAPLQHQAGFEYCIRRQELSPHTPKALENSRTVLIPHSGEYSKDLQPRLT